MDEFKKSIKLVADMKDIHVAAHFLASLSDDKDLLNRLNPSGDCRAEYEEILSIINKDSQGLNTLLFGGNVIEL